MRHSFYLCVLILTQLARCRTRPRDYDAKDYFVIDIEHENQLDTALQSLGAQLETEFGELRRHYLVSIPKNAQPSLRKRSQTIKLLEEQIPRQRNKRDKIPAFDESLFPQNTRETDQGDSLTLKVSKLRDNLSIDDPTFSKQWHLFNVRDSGHDINVTGVWEQGITGQNTVVALVDDGLDMNSLDLAANYYAEGSYDFNDHNPVPSPKLFDDNHGTRCAGEIAAVRNDVCGLGIAYEGKVSGLRILSGRITDADEAISLNYDYDNNLIYSCSWGPPDDGRSMEGPGLLIQRAIVNGVQNGRGGKGSIFVFASGNGAVYDDNCNFDGYTNSIFSITIGGIDRLDMHPYYSELCAPQLAVTYSSGAGDYIHTTDVGENTCSSNHGGTSAAAPIGAGIFALVLSVRPDLSWRDMQYLCAETAVPFALDDDDWQETSAGRKFNHKFGYGKLDAYAMVEKAKTWIGVKAQSWFHSPSIHVDEVLGDEPHQQITSYIEVSKEDMAKANLQRIEHITVTINIEHQRRGDVTVDLISPDGILSNLATARRHDDSSDGFVEWTLMTVKHWGESGVGQWRLVVGDHDHPEATGVFKDWRMTLWGESIDESKAVPLPIPGESQIEEESPPATIVNPVEVSTAPAPERPTPTTEIDDDMKPERPVLSKPTQAASPHTPLPTTIIQPLPEEEDTVPSKFDWLSKKAIWIYVAIASIISFISLIGIWVWIQKRRNGRLSKDHYEFKELQTNKGSSTSDSAGQSYVANDLYDAFRVSDESDDEGSRDSLDEMRPLHG